MAKRIMLAWSLALVASVAYADTVSIVADEWCPYNCEPDDALPGFMIEAAQAVLGAAGYEVQYITVDDWDEAVEEARAGKYDAIVGASVDDAPDFVFPEEYMGLAQNHFYVRKGDAWRYTDMDSLKGRRLAALSGYAYSEELDEWLPEHGFIFTSLDEAMDALFNDQVDAVVEAEYVMMLFAMQSFILDDIESAGVLNEEPDELYVAFSLANPNAQVYADLLTSGIRAMKADGSWNRLLSKYGIQ